MGVKLKIDRLPQIATPATPPAGYVVGPYVKANGYLYVLDSNGVETRIGVTNAGSAPVAFHFADAGNTGTTETDLYSDSIPADTLVTNGDRLQAFYSGTSVFSATGATRQVRVYFGGTQIFDSTALSATTFGSWLVRVEITRVSATVVRCSITLNTGVASVSIYTEVTGLTLSNANTLKITGTAAGTGAATNDIVAKHSTVVKWASGSASSAATDPIFDAKGDLVVGTGPDSSARLAVGANGTLPMADSAQSTGIAWATGPEIVRSIDAAPARSPLLEDAPFYRAVGVPGAIICLRFDDIRTSDTSLVAPELASRDLVATMACASGLVGGSGYGSWTDVANFAAAGHEIAGHSVNHSTPPANLAALIAELDDCTTAMVANGIQPPCHWIQPGTWNAGDGSYNFDTAAKLDTAQAVAISSRHASWQAYIADQLFPTGNHRTIPVPHRIAAQAFTCDVQSLATVKSVVDLAVASGTMVTLLFHSNFINSGGGNMTTTDFQNLLTYIQGHRDAGRCDVLTCSAGFLAYRRTAGRGENLLGDPGFEYYGTGTLSAESWAKTGTPTVVTTSLRAGTTGTQALQVDASNYAVQDFRVGRLRTVMVEGWCKVTSGTQARLIVRITNAGGSTLIDKQKIITPTANVWTKIRQAIGVPPTGNNLRIWPYNNGGSTVIWDDLAVYET